MANTRNVGTLVAAAVVVASTGCVDAEVLLPEQSEPISVSITPDSVVVDAIGVTAPLEARIDAGGTVSAPDVPPIEWTSSDTAVARVDAQGRVTSRGEGTAKIVASVLDGADTAVVVVEQVPAVVQIGLAFGAADPAAGARTAAAGDEPVATFQALGDTLRFVVTAVDRNGYPIEEPDVEWTSLDTGIATVDQGLVTAVSNGETRITVEVRGETASAPIRVQQKVDAVEIEPQAIVIAPSTDTVRFEAAATDRNGVQVVDAEFTWGSSDSSVFTINADGTGVGVAAGTAIVVATSGEAADTAEVTVDDEAEPAQPCSVTISAETDTLRYIGQVLELTATARNEEMVP